MNIEQTKSELNELEFDNQIWREYMPKDFSRRKIAKALNTTDSNLIAIEKGISTPSLLLAFRYCKLVGLEPAKLVKNK